MPITTSFTTTAGINTIIVSGNATTTVRNGRSNIVVSGNRVSTDSTISISTTGISVSGANVNGSSTPIQGCKRRWINFAFLSNSPQNVFQKVVKRIVNFIPLIFATVGAAMTNPFVLRSSPIFGSKVVKSRQVELNDPQMNSIVFNSIGELIVTKGKTCSLTTQADDNIIPYLQHHLTKGTLTLSVKNNVAFQTSSPIRYRLTIPHYISQVALHGSGKILLDGVNQKEFACTINGSGDVQVNGGATNQQEITINGSGGYLADTLKSKDIRVNISGSGDAAVWATEKLSVRIAGSGICHYRGHPIINKRIAGSGSVKESLRNKFVNQ